MYSTKTNRSRRGLTRNERKRRVMICQRLMALALIALSVLFIWMAGTADEDCCGGLLFGALGLYLLFTKRVCIG